jgi:hypothetical protein
MGLLTAVKLDDAPKGARRAVVLQPGERDAAAGLPFPMAETMSEVSTGKGEAK